jgi:FkbM family methyltransferase
MKSAIKSLMRHSPYQVIRARDPNRFQAIEETLLSLKRRGFSPSVVIDGGANVGEFARMARKIFGAEPHTHLFEPQPACQPALELLAQEPGFTLHAVALGAIDGEVALTVTPGAVNTGSRVALEQGELERVAVPMRPMDEALGSLPPRTLLKLDLQGYEMEALKGATSTLRSTEVALVEASFFAQDYEPPISVLVQFFDSAGFDLHDIASISPRARDNRARQADLVFVSKTSGLCRDTNWA